MAEQFKPPEHKIQAIEEVSPRHPVDKTAEAENVGAPDKIKFDQALERADQTRANLEVQKAQIAEAAQIPTKPSLIDIARQGKAVPTVAPTQETLVTDAARLKQKFEAPKAQLISYQEKNIEIPSEFAKQMDTRIEHMDRSLIDAKKITSGVQLDSGIDTSSSPTVRFLHYLTDADRRLDTIVGDINTYTAGGKRLSPEKLLSVQIKLNYVQQEMEFFTNILNRSIESIKTLMNVQI